MLADFNLVGNRTTKLIKVFRALGDKRDVKTKVNNWAL